MIQKNPNRQRYTANFQEAFYWERVNRSLGWLGQTDEEQRQRQAKLRELTVGIAGCGGIGGMVASRLGRLGIGRIKLADPDSFDISNINRQVGASPANLNRNKAEVVAQFVNDVTPDVDIEIFPEGITPESSEEFVDGCTFILDQMDFYEIKNRYALHRAFRQSPTFEFALKVPTVGHGTYIFKYTKDSMTIEKVYGVHENTALSPAVIRRLMERIMPEIPPFPSRETLDHWFIDLKRMPIFAACPPLAEGVLLERLALEMTGLSELIPGFTPIPVQPGYAMFDTASWTAHIHSGCWWHDNNVL
ncbi:ThiF family adenylyltransferase [Ferrovum sp.]|uniref:ThiF family adenylyltransferase n=1 Tax=Ferrovum sp. TaxID=2609467 RepID=UPI00262D4BFF|nr:ThiF family adenylyltransferase [Ferrovum sp.]